ncbi:hypothetical protein GQ55_2G230700 [Panicum hallii var. hallii]|uniref:Uncharacterized protein n=1 Tax=Panicum hallii var. hallii TaxID=1504633 RepID=A0A2T7ERJ0_9POAL|nr:hypothetical protein GQ55_2G230700 [Panicum hallii var. hallii]
MVRKRNPKLLTQLYLQRVQPGLLLEWRSLTPRITRNGRLKLKRDVRKKGQQAN